MKLQFNKITAKIENEKVRRSTTLWRLFKLVDRRVLLKAIELTKDLYNRYLPEAEDKPPVPPICRYNSKNTAGFLCIHLIIQYEEEEKSFELELFHQH